MTSAAFIYQLPNCTSCGAWTGQTMLAEASVVGGGVRDDKIGLSTYIMDSEDLITVLDTGCAFLWVKVPLNTTCTA